MAGRPAFLSLGFLFCCCPPCSPAAPPDSAQEGPWSRAPPDSAQLLVAGHEAGNRSDENRRPRPRLLRLAAACIATLPGPVLSGLRGRCPQELPSVQNQNQNHTRRALTAGCACEFLRGLRVPLNGTACAQMLRGCGGGGVALAVGLSLLLLALAGGVGCVWRWKHRGRAPLALPGFLRPRRRRGDYSQTLSAGPPGLGAKAAAPDPRAGAADPQGHYENLPARDPGAAPARGLYENAGDGAGEEHVYGNQPAGDYYNLHAPGAPAAPPDEDIYILPDAY